MYNFLNRREKIPQRNGNSGKIRENQYRKIHVKYSHLSVTHVFPADNSAGRQNELLQLAGPEPAPPSVHGSAASCRRYGGERGGHRRGAGQSQRRRPGGDDGQPLAVAPAGLGGGAGAPGGCRPGHQVQKTGFFRHA